MSPAALFKPVVVWLAMFAAAGAVLAQEPNGFRDDARSIEALVNAQYAYLDRFPDGVMPMSAELRAEAETVSEWHGLLRYAEHALLALADHHAITGASFADSWAVVPSYADLWIEADGAAFVIEAVRDGSPSAEAGVRPGDRLIAIGDVPVATGVAAFWNDLGLAVTGERAAFAARVLAAGRRDRERFLTVVARDGRERRLVLPNLYQGVAASPPLETTVRDEALVLRLDDSLGDDGTIAAFEHGLIYALLIILPIAGYVIWVHMKVDMTVFGLFSVPTLFTPPVEDERLRAGAWYVNYFAGWTLAGLVGLHVAAALFHQFVLRDGLLRRIFG